MTSPTLIGYNLIHVCQKKLTLVRIFFTFIFHLASKEDNIIFLLDTGLGGVIFRMDLDTQSYVPIPMNNLYTPTAFDYDPTDGRIYFVDYRLRQLMSVHFSGTDVRELKQLDASMNEIDKTVQLKYLPDNWNTFHC